MKRFFLLLLFLFGIVSFLAQTTKKMSYQSVLRDNTNALLTNQNVGMQISILQTTLTGNAVYVETQTTTTNINGFVSLEIGSGISSDDFSAIDWSAGPYFIKTATDPSGGNRYSIVGISQLMSDPSALYEKTLGSSIPGSQGKLRVREKTGANGSEGPQAIQGIQGVTGTFGTNEVKVDTADQKTQGIKGYIGATEAKGTFGTNRDISTTDDSNAEKTAVNGVAVKLMDNKGTIKYLQANNGITSIILAIPGSASTTTFQLGGTLVDATTITTTNDETFTIDGVGFNLKSTELNTDAAATATSAIADGTVTGYTILVRDELTGKVKKMLATEIAKGATGTDGVDGSQGDTGAIGATGIQGIQGTAGAEGSQGDTGATGAAGADGADGSQGATGAIGAQGDTGATGAIGATGIQGIQGTAGAEGSQGNTGATGAIGATGIQGIQGTAGADGSQGDTGATGTIGATGIQGIQGTAGADGSQGDTGAIGATGIQGIQGTAGADGSQGDTGATGAAGENGADGTQGATGEDGGAGLQGTASGDMQYWDGTAWVVIATTLNEGATLQMIGGIPTWVGGSSTEAATVGDFREGGIVFWVDPNDDSHGLVCAIEDQSAGIKWENGSNTGTTGATDTAIGKGSTNTTVIINQGAGGIGYAAALARAYNGGEYTDWFLPSKDELNEMYQYQTIINNTATTYGGSIFSNIYWSSTESQGWNTWHQFFDGTIPSQNAYGSMNNTFSVRSVRAF
jgi:hypothetical protein